MHIGSEIPDLQKYAESIPEGDRKQWHASVSVKFDFLDSNFHMNNRSEIPNLQKYAESIHEGDRKRRHASVSVKFDFLDDSQIFMPFSK
ncbi:hypothetical protein CDAR_585031 [Caerostris darwini]|uniref:Uncharacterized protein n=1 Tax=Caerostris darwini TaxID=1538125 RepID=A0AAV4VLA5_9ARAC|nr:hypothetical protein CDAR_585031 [Caerostris darwini]